MADPPDIKEYARPRAESRGLHWLSIQVPPETTSSNVGDESRRDMVFSGNGALPGASSKPDPDVLHLGIRQFGLRMVHAALSALWVQPEEGSITLGLSPLGDHVSRVSGAGTEPEMSDSWIDDAIHDIDPGIVVPDAPTHVAGMEHSQPIGDGGFARDLPGDSMGQCVRAVQPHIAVAASPGTFRPKPAETELGMLVRDGAIVAINVGPETRKARRGIVRVHRDLPLNRNRGARPGLLRAGSGLSVARILPCLIW
jgi:hypothetical protein